MCPPAYVPGTGGNKAVFGCLYIYLVLFATLWVIDLVMGVFPIIFTLDPGAPASSMPIYVSTISPTQYAQTLSNGLDYWLVRSSIFTILIYPTGLILDMIAYQDTYVYALTLTFFIVFGLIPEIVRAVWYVVYLAGCGNYWICQVWYTPFLVITICSLIRVGLGFLQMCDAFSLRTSGRMVRDKERSYGINQQ